MQNPPWLSLTALVTAIVAIGLGLAALILALDDDGSSLVFDPRAGAAALPSLPGRFAESPDPSTAPSTEAPSPAGAQPPADARPQPDQAPTESDGAILGVVAADGENGALLTTVAPNSPAAAVGLRDSDVITAVDGEAVSGVDDLRDAIQAHAPGDAVTLTVERGGATLALSVQLGGGPLAARIDAEAGPFRDGSDSERDSSTPRFAFPDLDEAALQDDLRAIGVPVDALLALASDPAVTLDDTIPILDAAEIDWTALPAVLQAHGLTLDLLLGGVEGVDLDLRGALDRLEAAGLTLDDLARVVAALGLTEPELLGLLDALGLDPAHLLIVLAQAGISPLEALDFLRQAGFDIEAFLGPRFPAIPGGTPAIPDNAARPAA